MIKLISKLSNVRFTIFYFNLDVQLKMGGKVSQYDEITNPVSGKLQKFIQNFFRKS